MRRLTSFVFEVFDRRRDDNVTNVRNDVDDDKTAAALPPYTFESYADALSDLLHLFSADLLQIENTVQVQCDLLFVSSIAEFANISLTFAKVKYQFLLLADLG